jgi:hypothetical protein
MRRTPHPYLRGELIVVIEAQALSPARAGP